MKRLRAAAILLTAVLGVGCAQGPSSTATATQAAASTATPGASAKPAFPLKAIQVIVPFGPGGALDTQSRLAQPYLEKALGVSLQIVNVPGAGSQVGVTRPRPSAWCIKTTAQSSEIAL